MKFVKLIFLFVAAFSLHANAQQHRAPKPQPVMRYKPPKLFSALGDYKDTMTIAVADAVNVIGMPLKITDAKNNIYTLSSYEFVYKQIVATEDDALSGKIGHTTSIKYSLFKASPLPAFWLNVIRENPKPGEELIFFDVIVKDAQGRVMYAPNLKLIME